jgi:hypothetical protein
MTMHPEYRAKTRFGLPPLWGFAIVLVIVVLYTAAVVSITASATAARLDKQPVSQGQEWHPPLKLLQPKDWLYKQ